MPTRYLPYSIFGQRQCLPDTYHVIHQGMDNACQTHTIWQIRTCGQCPPDTYQDIRTMPARHLLHTSSGHVDNACQTPTIQHIRTSRQCPPDTCHIEHQERNNAHQTPIIKHIMTYKQCLPNTYSIIHQDMQAIPTRHLLYNKSGQIDHAYQTPTLFYIRTN